MTFICDKCNLRAPCTDCEPAKSDVAILGDIIEEARTALSSRGYCGDGNLAHMITQALGEAEQRGRACETKAQEALVDASREFPSDWEGTVAERVVQLHQQVYCLRCCLDIFVARADFYEDRCREHERVAEHARKLREMAEPKTPTEALSPEVLPLMEQLWQALRELDSGWRTRPPKGRIPGFMQERLTRLASDAIGLFLEYRDFDGKDEDHAQTAAILEIVEALSSVSWDDYFMVSARSGN